MSATPQDCAISIGVESTYGTYATADRFYEFPDESLDVDKKVVQGQGLRSGSRLDRSARRALISSDGKGDFSLEAVSKGMGRLLKACFGYGNSATASGTTYQQLFRFGDTLDSLSIQKQIPQNDGSTITPYTFLGSTVDSWEFSCDNAGLAMLKVSIASQTMTTGQAAETISYVSSPNLFHFAQGTVSLAGTLTVPTTTALASMSGSSAANVRSFSISCDNKLPERRNFGNAGKRSNPLVPGPREVKGKMTLEFDSTTWVTKYLADTELAALLSFDTGVVISNSLNETLQVAIPAMKLNGEVPKANGGELITIDVDFDVLDGLSAAYPLYMVLRTADSAL